MAAGTVQKGHRAARGRRRGHKPMSEINVTPFVDVMLVLLIIFMVAAPLLTVGVEINLPNTDAKALPSEKEQPLTLSLTSAGKLILQETPIEPEDLILKLKAVSLEREDDRIFFRADGSNDYESVMKIMGSLSKAGFPNISLVTDTN
ncbi:MAG: protein TolR [Rhodobacteraceae bacterium]|nr:MAG: protein TolR [Paracoccaceae bacterium]